MLTSFSTVYNIVVPQGVKYLEFMCWIGLWSMVMHIFLAISNACNAVRWVTRFSCDIFGFYVALIYLQKGIQILTHQWENGDTAAYLAIAVALMVTAVAYIVTEMGTGKLFGHHVRVFLRDYGTILTIIFFTGFVHIGKMKDVDLPVLPRGGAFTPTADRGWIIHFWNLPAKGVFLAIPFAILLTILFYFGKFWISHRQGLPSNPSADHNVSSLICQGSEFPLRKPAGFHWDILLLGITTGLSGILGIPAPNGLIPQAPFHTASLCVTRQQADDTAHPQQKHVTVIDHVVEQRASNLLQGLIILFTMSGPIMSVLHLIPQGVLAGLFFVMGIQALEGNGMTQKMVYICSDRNLIPSSEPLNRCSKKSLYIFVAIELIGFGATFAITQTIAAVGFPVFIFLLIPMRTKLMPKWFPEEDLDILDEPTASPFTLDSVGGAYGGGYNNATEVNKTPKPSANSVSTSSVRDEARAAEEGDGGLRERGRGKGKSGDGTDGIQEKQ